MGREAPVAAHEAQEAEREAHSKRVLASLSGYAAAHVTRRKGRPPVCQAMAAYVKPDSSSGIDVLNDGCYGLPRRPFIAKTTQVVASTLSTARD